MGFSPYPQGCAVAADHLRIGTTYPHPYQIPARPPADLLAELDEATRVLDERTARAEELTLGMDRQTRSLRIEHRHSQGTHDLTPTQLFAMLAGH